jgi:hypothetical protein
MLPIKHLYFYINKTYSEIMKKTHRDKDDSELINRNDKDLFRLVKLSRSLIGSDGESDRYGRCKKELTGFRGYINKYGDCCKDCYDEIMQELDKKLTDVSR